MQFPETPFCGPNSLQGVLPFRCDWVYRRVVSSGVAVLGPLVALSILVACGKGNVERVQLCATVLLFRLDDDDIGVVPRAIEKDALAI